MWIFVAPPSRGSSSRRLGIRVAPCQAARGSERLGGRILQSLLENRVTWWALGRPLPHFGGPPRRRAVAARPGEPPGTTLGPSSADPSPTRPSQCLRELPQLRGSCSCLAGRRPLAQAHSFVTERDFPARDSLSRRPSHSCGNRQPLRSLRPRGQTGRRNRSGRRSACGRFRPGSRVRRYIR